MNKNRLEAFGDAIIAIIITIMVLEFRVPTRPDWAALGPMLPQFLAYLLSFIFLTIYWNNHHHLFHAVERINGAVLWANMHLMFWLSLIPFTTAWLSEVGFRSSPVMLYGIVLFFAGFAHTILVRLLIALHGKQSRLAIAVGKDIKGKLSVGLYAFGLLVAAWVPILAIVLYVMVAVLWLIPDRRFESFN